MRCWSSWDRFAKAAGEKAGDKKWMNAALSDRGFVSRRSHGNRVYNSVRLRSWKEVNDQTAQDKGSGVVDRDEGLI